MNVRVFVYSPIRLFADGVAQCLADAPQVEASGCCSLDLLSAALARGDIDVLLFDVTDDGVLAAAKSVITAFPAVAAVALALPEVLDLVIACAVLGFVSYVPRNASMSELREIVDRAVRREVLCHPAVAGGLLRELQRRAVATTGQAKAALTRREHQVFVHLAQGLTNKEIARHLGLSAATVKNHVHNILAKNCIGRRGDVRGHAGSALSSATASGETETLFGDGACAGALPELQARARMTA